METTQEFTIEEIEKNNGENGNKLWVIIGKKVYDVSTYKHPGGREMFEDAYGEDRLDEFNSIGHSPAAIQEMKKLHIGFVKPKPKPVKKKLIDNKQEEEDEIEEMEEEDSKNEKKQSTSIITPVLIFLVLFLILAYFFLLKK